MTVTADTSASTPDLGQIYRESRTRLVDLVRPLDDETRSIPVAACPGWTVHDVVAHLVSVAEDVMAGRLMRPPTDEESAEQVSRRRSRSIPEMLEEWDALGPAFAELIAGAHVWPGAIDMLSHEHDVRAALGQPGARDADGVRMAAAFLIDSLQPPVPLLVRVDDVEHSLGPEGGADLVLDTDSFEALRFRLGRRSRKQLSEMRWSGDPAPVLDHLCAFGPSIADIVE